MPTRRVVAGCSFTDYMLVLKDSFGQQAHAFLAERSLYWLFETALDFAFPEDEGLPFNVYDLVGCRFSVVMGQGDGVVLERTHGNKFVARDVASQELYDLTWPTYSDAERDCKEAGLALSTPEPKRWNIDPENIRFNRDRLGFSAA